MSGENRKGECPRLTSGKPSQYRDALRRPRFQRDEPNISKARLAGIKVVYL